MGGVNWRVVEVICGMVRAVGSRLRGNDGRMGGSDGMVRWLDLRDGPGRGFPPSRE